jgi:hypothetical protein
MTFCFGFFNFTDLLLHADVLAQSVRQMLAVLLLSSSLAVAL